MEVEEDKEKPQLLMASHFLWKSIMLFFLVCMQFLLMQMLLLLIIFIIILFCTILVFIMDLLQIQRKPIISSLNDISFTHKNGWMVRP